MLFRDVFGKGAETVQKLSECSEDGAMLADVLAHLFYLPVRHLHEYSHLLLKLASCYDPVRLSARDKSGSIRCLAVALYTQCTKCLL